MSRGGDERVTRSMWAALAAMTIAASMILVDQTAVPLATPRAVSDIGGSISESQWLLTASILPLAAFLMLGGRIGDLFGLRRVVLVGAVTFAVATALAAAAQTMPVDDRRAGDPGLRRRADDADLDRNRLERLPGVQEGHGPRRGWRAARPGSPRSGPTGCAAAHRPARRPAARRRAHRRRLRPHPGARRGLGRPRRRRADRGRDRPPAAFCVVELRTTLPLVDIRLFRHRDFLAANISQVLAGMVELGLGFLLPYFLLRVVGVDPAVAGVALIPATVPIILAGPLAGRLYDRFGGRWPLVGGYPVLAASGLALGIAAGAESAVARKAAYGVR